MDEKKYKLICVRKGKTNYARTNNRKNVTLGSYTAHANVCIIFPLILVGLTKDMHLLASVHFGSLSFGR